MAALVIIVPFDPLALPELDSLFALASCRLLEDDFVAMTKTFESGVRPKAVTKNGEENLMALSLRRTTTWSYYSTYN